MNALFIKSLKFKKGFTLLELLIVVGILAALVALALPFYQDYLNQSKLTAAEADLKTFAKALAMYDQMEPEPFSSSDDFRGLIGKYLQDFRTNDDQKMPIDPWSNEYKCDVAAGSIWSMGPNGTDDTESTTNHRKAAEDDILVTWKPDFFVNGVKRINNRVLQISFSRRVPTLSVADVTVSGCTTTSIQKVSDTIYRAKFQGDLPKSGESGASVTITDTVACYNGRTLSEAQKPDLTDANTMAY